MEIQLFSNRQRTLDDAAVYTQIIFIACFLSAATRIKLLQHESILHCEDVESTALSFHLFRRNRGRSGSRFRRGVYHMRQPVLSGLLVLEKETPVFESKGNKARGIERRKIFIDEQDRLDFLTQTT